MDHSQGGREKRSCVKDRHCRRFKRLTAALTQSLWGTKSYSHSTSIRYRSDDIMSQESLADDQVLIEADLPPAKRAKGAADDKMFPRAVLVRPVLPALIPTKQRVIKLMCT